MRTAVFKSANTLVGWLLQQAAERIDITHQPKRGAVFKGQETIQRHGLRIAGAVETGPHSLTGLRPKALASFSRARSIRGMGLVDTHTHLESFARRGTLEGALARAREAGVEAMITIGTSPDDWSLYRDLATKQAGWLRYTVGLHPCEVEEGWEKGVSAIEAFWAAGRDGREPPNPATPRRSAGEPGDWQNGINAAHVPIALGECGLDRFHLPKDAAEAERSFSRQRGAFGAQLEIAKRLGCPVVVHSRGAFRECVEMVDASGVEWSRVVFHCFTEGPAEMAELNGRGGVGSFTGILTYKTAEAVRQAAKAQGLGRFMVETDAPYLTPMPHRGKPNEPAYVRLTAEFAAAEVFRVNYEELAAATTANARRFFDL